MHTNASSPRPAWLATACSILLLTGTAFGQATSGSITGIVSDTTGGSIPAAKVTLTEVNKGVSFEVTTSDLGFYIKALIPAGVYTIRVEKAGFKTFVRPNAVLSVDSTVRVDAVLQVGEVVEQVVVSADVPLLKSERADVSTHIENYLVNRLPTLGRNFAYLQLVVPGAVRQPGMTGLAENPQQSLSVFSNGQPNGARNVQLDGVDNNENVLGGNIVLPNIDSIREVKITTSSWDAEFGRAGGALTQVETKSGENAIHGSLFHFLRHDKTNARNSFTQPKEPPPFRWNQFGGSFGGAIKKNKTFYFGEYQGARQRLGNTTFASVPTAQMRLGDFSQVRDSAGRQVPIFDPLGGNANGSGRMQFPDNRIPAARQNAVARSLFPLLPAPSFPDQVENNLIAVASTKFNTDQWSTRLDHYLSDNTRLFGRYIQFDSDLFSPPIFGEGGGPSVEGGVGGFSTGKNRNLSINVNHIYSPALLQDFRYGYSRYGINVLHPDNGTNLSDKYGLPGLNTGDLNTSGLAGSSTNGIGAFRMGGRATCNCPLDQLMRHHQWATNLNWTRGSHSVKFGADIRKYANLRIGNGGRIGGFGFTPGITGSSAITNSGFATASLFLGEASSFSRQFNLTEDIGNESELHTFFYVQDQWKINRKLTLNYGLRYEIYTPPATPTRSGSNFEFATGLVWIAGVGEVPNRVGVRVDRNNFAPRLGLTYLINDKTVLRLGGARSFFPNVFNILISGNWPLQGSQQLIQPTNFAPVITLGSQPPAFAGFPAIPSNGKVPLPIGIGITGNPFDRRTAYVDSWNFTLQRTISSTLSVESAYVGNVGRQLYWNVPMNVPIPGPGPFDPRRPLFAKFGYNQNISVRGNSGSSNYHSLQLQATKKAAKGLAFIMAYTWSKTIDFGSGGGGYDVVTDPQNARNDRSVANRDRASVFSLGHVYELPFGPGKRFLSGVTGVGRQLVEGWSFSGISISQSGPPYSAQLGNNSSLNSTFTLRPDLVGDPELAKPDRNKWYNPAAFGVPALYRQGNVGRNTLRGPGLFNAGWAVGKTFHPTERTSLEFRMEAFNALNNTNLALPNGNVDNPQAGRITGLIGGEAMRQMQFGLRLAF